MVLTINGEFCIATGHSLSGTKNLKNFKIWHFSIFKDSKNQILNNSITKEKKIGEHTCWIILYKPNESINTIL